MRPWVHYFIPTIAASIYAMQAGGVRVDLRRSAVFCGALIALLVVWDLRSQRPAAVEARQISRVASVLDAGLPSGAHIATDRYDPGLYLATGAPLIDRFQLSYEWNMPFVQAVTHKNEEQLIAHYVGAADAVVTEGDPAALPYSGQHFVEVCAAQVAPWHVLVRPSLARNFVHCASAGGRAGS